MTSGQQFVIYIRRSTADQTDEHQRKDIHDWLDDHGLSIEDVAVYAEQASGASDDRDEFNELIGHIKKGEVTDVVVWEISRIARKGLLAQQFFDACEDNSVTVHVTNGSVRKIKPDGHGRLVADVIASVAAQERRQLIRRTKAGMRRAREREGKWVGQVPVGFVVNDGYLKPNLNPVYEDDETGFFDIVDALEAIENGESYNKAAKRTPNVTRQTLSNIHQTEKRRRWYIEAEADDERVQDALEQVTE
jgi:DNA invertase Pin-like site-specific DNA recombinase